MDRLEPTILSSVINIKSSQLDTKSIEKLTNETSSFFILDDSQEVVVDTQNTQASSEDESEKIIPENSDVYEVIQPEPVDYKQIALKELDAFYSKLNRDFIRGTEDSSEFEIIGEDLQPMEELENLEDSFEELKIPSQDNIYELSYNVRLRELGGLQSTNPQKFIILPNTYDKFAAFFNGMVESLTKKASAQSIIAPFILLFLAIPFFFAKKINSNNTLSNRILRAEEDDKKRIASAKVHNEKIQQEAKEYAKSMKARWIQHYERDCIKKYTSDQLEKTNTIVKKIMEKLSEEVGLFPYRVRNEMRYLFNKLFS